MTAGSCDLAGSKRVMRRICAERRAAATSAVGVAVVEMANRFLLRALGARRGDVVAGYRPIRTEIDPGPALSRLAANGVRLCLPVVTLPNAPLEFRAWAPGDALEAGAFGVEVPAFGCVLRPTHVITPLLAWDRTGRRLGYGGGFYDRTLRGLREETSALRAVGFGFAAQEAAEIPWSRSDERLDAIATEIEFIEVAAG